VLIVAQCQWLGCFPGSMFGNDRRSISNITKVFFVIGDPEVQASKAWSAYPW